MHQSQRREIKLRQASWSTKLAAALARAQVSPNEISIASVMFASLGAAAFYGTTIKSSAVAVAAAFIIAAISIQLRLLCNMLDGMVAVENGKSTPSGELFNEFPDRLSDTILLVGAGYAAGGGYAIFAGWFAACLAMATAYIRAFGARYLTSQDFQGPMAKQHRMFTLTVGALASAAQYLLFHESTALTIALSIICLGTAYTVHKRATHLSNYMERRTC